MKNSIEKIPRRKREVIAALCLLSLVSAAPAASWPEITSESKPWTRWWWMGSAVTPSDLTIELEALRNAGIGGVEITPIYGVAGYEEQFIPFLSSNWVNRLEHTLKEADRFGLGVDMATGTGWPFGGLWVDADNACKYVAHQTYTLKGGERLAESITFTQRTVLRAVGNQVYQLYGEILRPPGEAVTGTRENPQLRPGAGRIQISDLVEPISSNKNLQALALDQVRFLKPLPLQVLMAYSRSGEVLDLTGRVGANGVLDWTAPEGEWTLYAVFQGWHGKMVERAAPGGEGNVIDHFSRDAIRDYLIPFDRAFQGRDIGSLRAFFNDSYEVDDASGEADWTPRFFHEFKKRRGYDLREHLPALFGRDSSEKSARVLCDYRETISDLLLETFTLEWRNWSRAKDALIRNQAHGSPANLLDLYAASDIPETEGTDLLRIKVASSAAHVTGKKLTSAEAATWLNEHFRSTLWDVKQNLDRYFLGGVNHVVYHGTCYSPQAEPWPGWLFYAAVHFNSRNSWWQDFSALNAYVARAQSFLQLGEPDNDVLLYFPISDTYSTRGNALLHHFDGALERLTGDTFKEAATALQERGYMFDFISDRLLQDLDAAKLRGTGARYRAIVVPRCDYVPLETMRRLVSLARGGATVVFLGGIPRDVAGFGNLETRRAEFRKLLEQVELPDRNEQQSVLRSFGSGVVIVGNDIDATLRMAGVERETCVDQGLQVIRRREGGGRIYFIANRSDVPFDGWLTLRAPGEHAVIYDLMRGESGIAQVRNVRQGALETYVELAPGESVVVRTAAEAPNENRFVYYRSAGESAPIRGEWNLRFHSGGPELPAARVLTSLGLWTDGDDSASQNFSGTAEYSIGFSLPEGGGQGWWLDLGEVRESARVRLNGRALGVLIGPPYRVYVPEELLGRTNTLQVWVSNLMANRIADMDRRNVPWKKFYNVNFPARLGANRGANGLFNASRWEPLPSGLLGPVTLTPVRAREF